MLGTIHSVVIWTDDVRRLTPFYRDKLGLQAEMESEEFTIFAADQPGAAQLALGRHSEVSGRSKEPHRIMIDFLVKDCQAAYDDLRSRGVEFLREPGIDQADGFSIATFQDPDGNTLQLFQPPA
jgi:predicted enzyme related to lactoylglutathione lyase